MQESNNNIIKLITLIVYREYDIDPNVLVFQNIETALTHLTQDEILKEKIEHFFVIGGAEIYREALELSKKNLEKKEDNTFFCKNIYLTLVHAEPNCDAFFLDLDTDPIASGFHLTTETVHPTGHGPDEVIQENGLKFQFLTYTQ